MLRACHRVLRPGGAMAYYVVRVPDDLSVEQRERAAEIDEGFATPEAPYAELMRRAGFVDIVEDDVSAEYAVTTAGWLRGAEQLASRLEVALGRDVYAEKQARRRRMLAAAEEGLMGRSFVFGRRPG